MPTWLQELSAILLLLAAVGVVLRRLPKVELGHSAAFKKRRFLNWFPLGLTYALLYFGRYNLSANQPTLDTLGLLTKAEFGNVDGIGSIVYGIAFIINGPLADRWGGRATILIAAAGSAAMNLLLAGLVHFALLGQVEHESAVTWLTVLFSANMYFQSFGAVSIVKVNAPWFHVRERGVLGGVFGILISLGLYFSYDWSRIIAKSETFGMTGAFIPAAVGARVPGDRLLRRARHARSGGPRRLRHGGRLERRHGRGGGCGGGRQAHALAEGDPGDHRPSSSAPASCATR
jgi:OPA family glycerol-3-phosphate transporter-like MFS transporter